MTSNQVNQRHFASILASCYAQMDCRRREDLQMNCWKVEFLKYIGKTISSVRNKELIET